MISITITRARVVNGRVEVQWSDGSGQTWPTLADFVGEQDQAIFEDVDGLKRIALALIARLAPNLANAAAVEGRTLTLDPTIANILRRT